jgi:hypothetical protein
LIFVVYKPAVTLQNLCCNGWKVPMYCIKYQEKLCKGAGKEERED